jgi:hypothetical protein
MYSGLAEPKGIDRTALIIGEYAAWDLMAMVVGVQRFLWRPQPLPSCSYEV